MTEGIVEFKDWEKLDLRIGKILEIEDIEGADKLYKLIIYLGDEIGKRTICAGIKEHYPKEELKGKIVVIFINLAPRKLRGIESQGMILAACNKDESEIRLIQPDRNIEIGSKVR